MTVSLDPLPVSFFQRSAIKVCRDLLGCRLVRRVGISTSVLEITEAEAYLGAIDAASHAAFGRRTERVEPMYGPAGHAYVYFVYGMHWCLNAVCAREGVAEAVLIRAGRPLEGESTMLKRRGLTPGASADDIAGGPAKLCQAMGIDGECNRQSLNSLSLFVTPGHEVDERNVMRGPRVGVDYAGAVRGWPLRYLVSREQ